MEEEGEWLVDEDEGEGDEDMVVWRKNGYGRCRVIFRRPTWIASNRRQFNSNT